MAGISLHQRCWNHEAREAVCRCPQCGRSYCRECVTEHEARLLCAACLQKIDRAPRARRPGRRLAAAGLALAGILFAWLLFYGAGEAMILITSRMEQASWQTPVERAGAIRILEDAVHLLRRAPLATWLCHSAGAVPFAMALLVFWNDVLNPRTSDARCALESLVLALALLWMNCWRAVFAGRLRAQLSGTANPAWSAQRIWSLAAAQSFLGPTRLAATLVAGLVMFPLAATASFYRNAAVLSGYEDLGLGGLIAKARRLAGLETGQSWSMLAILTLLYVLAALNVAMVLAVLPQLVRMLTGYESTFSRSGLYYVANPLFAMLVFTVTWIAFDPVVQAAYSVRCFRGESMETGEDLRVALRQRYSSLCFWFAVPPAELDRSVRQAMQSPEYDWRIPPAPGSAVKPSWLVSFADRILTGIKSISRIVGGALDRLYKWLFPTNISIAPAGAPPAAGLHWSLYVLIGGVLALVVWIAWRKLRSRRVKSAAAPAAAAAIRLDAEDLSADRLPEERWNELGEQSLREGNPRFALRAFYLGSLAWLGRRELLAIDPGKTNREYAIELARRARAFPEARGLFAENVAAFERAWYGMHEVGPVDVDEFRRRIVEMKSNLASEEVAA